MRSDRNLTKAQKCFSPPWHLFMHSNFQNRSTQSKVTPSFLPRLGMLFKILLMLYLMHWINKWRIFFCRLLLILVALNTTATKGTSTITTVTFIQTDVVCRYRTHVNSATRLLVTLPKMACTKFITSLVWRVKNHLNLNRFHKITSIMKIWTTTTAMRAFKYPMGRYINLQTRTKAIITLILSRILILQPLRRHLVGVAEAGRHLFSR